MRRFFAAIGAVSVAIALSGVAASANSGNDGGYNPPPQVQGVCDAGHGAFGAFSHHFQGGTSFDGNRAALEAGAALEVVTERAEGSVAGIADALHLGRWVVSAVVSGIGAGRHAAESDGDAYSTDCRKKPSHGTLLLTPASTRRLTGILRCFRSIDR